MVHVILLLARHETFFPGRGGVLFSQTIWPLRTRRCFGFERVTTGLQETRHLCTREFPTPHTQCDDFGKPTLRQTCFWEKPEAPFAFKDLMIH